jgi:hypothetical protein
MAKKKSISGKISLYASTREKKASSTRNYSSKSDRNRIIEHWKKLYRLDRKNYYVIQIEPDVN